MEKSPSGKILRFTVLTGNILDHFDTALYSFLAPFLAPQIFPNQDPIIGLILTYAFMFQGILTRPLGAFFFGHMIEIQGFNFAFSFSLFGVFFTTGCMGILPTYDLLGNFSAVILFIIRSLQGFFSAGEMTVAPFFIMKGEAKKKLGKIGSYLQSSTILGILLASGAATLVSFYSEAYPHLWRVPFLMGGCLAFIAFLFRTYMKFPVNHWVLSTKQKSWNIIKNHKRTFLRIVAVSSFTYLTYVVPFVLMNNFVPLFGKTSLQEMMLLTNTLLVFDMLLLPIFGKLSDAFSARKFMIIPVVLLMLSIVPIFYFLPEASIAWITGIRMWIILLGVIFLSPLYRWFYEVAPDNEAYSIVGIGYAIGSEWIGRSIPALGLWIWHVSQMSVLTGFYLMFVCLLALLALL